MRNGRIDGAGASEGPLILFATSFFGRAPAIAHLNKGTDAIWSTDRRLMPVADVVIVHIPNFRSRRRIRKYPGQIWVAWSLESPAHYPQMADPAFMRQFDLTMTHEQGADVWAPYLPRPHEWPSIQAAPIATQREAAPVAMFISGGVDKSGRTQMVTELFRHVRVDSYGKLFNNRALATPDLGHITKIETAARYPFCLAFENAIGPDYVTEKIYDALLAGSIPVYFGAPNVAEFVPEGCYIDAAAYGGGRELGTYLNYLAAHPEAAQRYHAWRRRPLPPALMKRSASVEREAFVRLLELCTERLGALPRRRHRSPIRRSLETIGLRLGVPAMRPDGA